MGHDKSEIELLAQCEKSEWMVSKNTTVDFYNEHNEWAISRHENNMLRGDRSTIDGHKRSMQTVGLLLGRP